MAASQQFSPATLQLRLDSRLNEARSTSASNLGRSRSNSLAVPKAQPPSGDAVIVSFSARAKNFVNNNSEAIGRILVGAGALAILGVATGGIGVAIAIGAAALSWGIKKAIQKIGSSVQKSGGEGETLREREGEKPHL